MAPVDGPLDAVQKALAKAKAIREKAAAAGPSLPISWVPCTCVMSGMIAMLSSSCTLGAPSMQSLDSMVSTSSAADSQNHDESPAGEIDQDATMKVKSEIMSKRPGSPAPKPKRCKTELASPAAPAASSQDAQTPFHEQHELAKEASRSPKKKQPEMAEEADASKSPKKQRPEMAPEADASKSPKKKKHPEMAPEADASQSPKEKHPEMAQEAASKSPKKKKHPEMAQEADASKTPKKKKHPEMAQEADASMTPKKHPEMAQGGTASKSPKKHPEMANAATTSPCSSNWGPYDDTLVTPSPAQDPDMWKLAVMRMSYTTVN